MNILQHDFGGYPYPADLSRALAERGHRVTHAWCGSLTTTPGGKFVTRESDPESLRFEAIELPEPLEKQNLVHRWRQEREYGRRAVELTRRVRPDVVLSANMPLDAQVILQRDCRRRQIPFVFWLQDVIGLAADRLLRERIPVVGAVIGRYYLNLEARILRLSDAVVPITEDFLPVLERWGVARERITTIENWAPVAELPTRPKNNDWSRSNGLQDAFVFLYAGTIGMKHDPDLIVGLAEAMKDRPDVKVVVLSQGQGADYLADQQRRRHLDNLQITGFEPFERMPEVMGGADVLLAILQAEAGTYSVPSKVLAYLCAERPLLLAIPGENLAGRIVDREDAGLVVEPKNDQAFLRAAETLLADGALRERMGRNARAYAERAFEIQAIADRFEAVLEGAIGRSTPP